MARLTQIRSDRPFSALGHTWADPRSAAFQAQVKAGQVPATGISCYPHPEAELSWASPGPLLWALARSAWGERLNDSLQCIAQDAQGDALLSAFLPLVEVADLVTDAALAPHLTGLADRLPRWWALGVREVVFEGYRR